MLILSMTRRVQIRTHGYYASISSFRTKILSIFDVYLEYFESSHSMYLFIRRFLAKPLAAFCGILVMQHWSECAKALSVY